MNMHAFNTWIKRPSNQLLLGVVAIPAFFLVRTHWIHLMDFLPYLLLLLCPLMHLFMHGSHHGGHSAHRDDDQEKDG